MITEDTGPAVDMKERYRGVGAKDIVSDVDNEGCG